MTMLVRKYQPGEECELWDLFFNTVRTIGLRDYTLEQVQAWAPEEMDEAQWKRRMETMNPFVCVEEGSIIGYAGLLDSGYIDHFYVHHRWQSRGVGKLLFAAIEQEARRQGVNQLSADVSITAREFFESRGFRVVRQQEVPRGSVVLTNFKMVRQEP